MYDHFADSDDDAIAKLRGIIDHLPKQKKESHDFLDPLYDQDELYGILAKSSNAI